MIKKYKYSLILSVIGVLTFASFTILPISKMDELVEKWEKRIYGYPQTKVFIHTDKPYYTIGDDIWFSVYATNASDHSSKSVSDLVYVTLEDESGKIFEQRNIRLDDRFGKGDFKIESKVKPGKIVLKAYTNYMRNYDEEYIFSKEILLIGEGVSESYESDNKLIDGEKKGLEFYPEGGELISGLMTKVAFEVLDHKIDNVVLRNRMNEEILVAKTSAPGIGYFTFMPKLGESYFVDLKGENYELPKVRSKGYGLKVNNLNPNKLFIDVDCSEGINLDGAFIIGHIRGEIFLKQDSLSGTTTRLKIDKSKLPNGVAQVTLFTKGGKPIAERTIFLDHSDNQIKISSKIPYEYLNRRQKADLSIQLSDAQDKPINGDFSISIVDNSTINGIEKAVNIKSYMLLASEFSQHIEDPNQYFNDQSKKTKFLLDLQMMTKGWTRFKWEDMTNLNDPHISYIPESGFTLSGLVLYKGDPVEAQVELVSMDETMLTEVIKTNPDGTFRVTGIYLLPKTNLFLKASIPNLDPSKEGKTDNVRLVINNTNQTKVNTSNIIKYKGESSNEALVEYIATTRSNQVQDSMYASMFIELEEVSISAKKKTRDQKLRVERGIVHSHYDKRIFLDSIMEVSPYKTIFDIVRESTPGVTVVGNPGFDQRFRFRGGSNTISGNLDAEVMIDGVRASVQSLNAMSPTMIEFVDVLKGLSSTSIYNAPNGVIAIFTKQGATTYDDAFSSRPDYVAYITHEGYYFAREFYHPDYGRAVAGNEKVDNRTTLYWNPRVTTEGGKGSVGFYTADNETKYLIEIQGLTVDGRPFIHYDDFLVK